MNAVWSAFTNPLSQHSVFGGEAMATGPDYYAVLGVSSTSDDVVIRAAFKALMLKYHPDTNRGADATQRAAAINEAFSVLGDPQRRAAYDASRARGSTPPPPPPPNPPPSPPAPAPMSEQPPSTSAMQPGWLKRLGGFVAVVLIGGIVRVAIHEANRPSYSSAAAAYTSGNEQMDAESMDTMTDNMTAVDQLASINGAPEGIMMDNGAAAITNSQASSDLLANYTYQAPTNVDFKVIESAAGTFAKVLNRGGIMGARAWSQDCHDKAEKAPSWSAADRCAAFDYAARYIDAGMVQAADLRPNPYFLFQADNQADNYKIVGGQPYTVGERLRRIRAAVEPVTYDAVMSGVRQREAKRAAETTEQPATDVPALANQSQE